MQDTNWSYVARQRDRYYQHQDPWLKTDCLNRIADEIFSKAELRAIRESGWTKAAIAKAEKWFREHESELDAAKESDLRSLEAALAEGAL